MFAFMLDGESLREGALLVGSLRAFGGAMKDLPVLCMVPGGADTLPLAEREKFVAYGCDFASFEPDERTAGLPFATKVSAAAEAERLSRGKADILVWLDHDTVFAREPSELRLPPGALIGARPVHHRLIGPLWDGDPDQYWAAVYRVCGADRGGRLPDDDHHGQGGRQTVSQHGTAGRTAGSGDTAGMAQEFHFGLY